MEDIQLDSLEGVGPVTERKLADAGIHNIMDLVVRGPIEISNITSMEKEAAEKLVIETVSAYTDDNRLVISGNIKNLGSGIMKSVTIDEIAVSDLVIT